MIQRYSSLCGNIDIPRIDDTLMIKFDKFKDDRMNARACKILSHKFVKCDISIWVDANIYTQVPDETMVKEMLKDYDVVFFKHTHRDCVYDEIAACKILNKETDESLKEYLDFLRDEKYPEHNGLMETGCIIRRHNERVIEMNNMWWAELTRYSKRDQISLPYVLSKLPNLNYGVIDASIFNYKYLKGFPHKQ